MDCDEAVVWKSSDEGGKIVKAQPLSNKHRGIRKPRWFSAIVCGKSSSAAGGTELGRPAERDGYLRTVGDVWLMVLLRSSPPFL